MLAVMKNTPTSARKAPKSQGVWGAIRAQMGRARMGMMCLAVLGCIWTSAAVAQSCSVSSTILNFPGIISQPNVQLDTTATISMACTGTSGTTVRACISIGVGSGGTSLSPRQLANGTNKLNFNIFSDAGRSQIWGERNFTPSPHTVDFVLGSGTTKIAIPMYGRIFSGQSGKPLGTYSSTFSGALGGELRLTNTATSCATHSGPRTRFTFQAKTTIAASCVVTAQPLNFGSVGSLGTVINNASTLDVICSNGLPYSIALNGGTVSGNIAARAMGVGGAPPSMISYQLYTTSARTTVWGNGTTGSTVAGTGSGVSQTINVFGRVPVQATPAQNAYSDTITATLSY